MKLRLHFFFTDLSQRFRIYLVVFALKFFIHGHGLDKRECKIICDTKLNKSDTLQPQLKYKTRNFPNSEGASTKNVCHTEPILAIKQVGGSGESIKT